MLRLFEEKIRLFSGNYGESLRKFITHIYTSQIDIHKDTHIYTYTPSRKQTHTQIIS